MRGQTFVSTGLRGARVVGSLLLHGSATAVVLGLAWVVRMPQPARRRLAGERVTGMIERLGPTFIKVGQLLSTREDLLPPELLVPLRRLQDHVRPAPNWRRIRRSIETGMGGPIEAVFSEFDRRPVATASIAHVYRARISRSDQLVALKVRRPGIGRTVNADGRMIRRVGKLLERMPSLRSLPITAALDEVLTALHQQLNFRREAENNRRFQRLFADTPAIRIPVLLDEHCSDELIVMEFVEQLRRLDDPEIPEQQFARATQLILHVVYRMIFSAGFIHCDLHPSNVCVTHVGDLVILDTGFVASLTEVDRRRFSAFFLGMVFDDAETCARILLKTASGANERFDATAFRRQVGVLVARTSGLKAGEFQVARFVASLFELQRRHGLRGSTNFTMAILALLVVEGVVRHRVVDLDFQRMAVPYVRW